MTSLYCNVNKPGPSINMPLPTLKLYYNDLPKMGWPLKTRLRTEKMEKSLTSFKISCNLGSLCTVIWDFDILYYLTMLCFAISYSVNYLLLQYQIPYILISFRVEIFNVCPLCKLLQLLRLLFLFKAGATVYFCHNLKCPFRGHSLIT